MSSIANSSINPLLLRIGLFMFLSGYFLLWTNKSYNNSIYIFCCLPAFYFLITELRCSLRSLSRNPILIALLCYLVYLPVSSLWYVENQLSDTLHFYKNALTIFLFVIFAAHIIKEDQHLYTNAFFYCSVGASIVAICSYIVWQWYPEYSRLYTPDRLFGVTRATMIEGYGVALLASCFTITNHKETWRKSALAFSIAILFIFILFSGSRITLLATLIAPLTILLFKQQRRVIIFFSIIISCLSLAFFISDELRALFFRGEPWRFKIWQHFFNEALQNPWFGAGLNSRQEVTIEGLTFLNTHNSLLSSFHSGGLLGVILHILIYITGLITAVKNRKNPIVILASIILSYGFIAELTSGGRLINNPSQQWLYIWMPIGMLLGVQQSSHKTKTCHSDSVN